MKKLNIILIGFMGCGKTCAAKNISRRGGYTFTDTDSRIEEMEKMTISEIFAQKGEDYFRRLEKELCAEISEKNGRVVSTGGGIIKDKENIENLRKNGIIVYLKATPHQISRNLKGDSSRPLLAGGGKKEKIKTLLSERRPLYEKTADIIINVSNKSKAKTAKNILRKVRKFEKSVRYTRSKP